MDIEIEKTAELARIRLRKEEGAKLKKDLNAILKYVEKLNALDTEHVEAMSHVLNVENVTRPDRAHPSGVRDDALKHAPSAEGNFFKVPKTVEKS